MWNADESLAENETRWGKKEIIFSSAESFDENEKNFGFRFRFG